MNPFALVFELIPKFCSAPPPKQRPWSRIAKPSPVATKSFSLHGVSQYIVVLPVGSNCVAKKSESGRSSAHYNNVGD